MLQHFLRLSRLTSAVVILYIRSVSSSARTIRPALRHLVDRSDRRDLSIFQIDLCYTEGCLTNAIPFQSPLYSLRLKENRQAARFLDISGNILLSR